MKRMMEDVVEEKEMERKKSVKRRWSFLEPKRGNESKKIRVMSWNILAQYLLIKEEGVYKESIYLDPLNRFDAIINEINQYCCDVICLQELDEPSLILPNLIHQFKVPYVHHYFRRTGLTTHDGCSISFNFSKFQLVEKVELVYNIDSCPILKRDNIALLLVLNLRFKKNCILIVCNTHILFNPNRGDIKLSQLRLMLEEISRLKKKYSKGKVHVVLAGDFNLLPSSSLYAYLATGIFDMHSIDRSKISNQELKVPDFVDGKQHHQGGGTSLGIFKAFSDDRKSEEIIEGRSLWDHIEFKCKSISSTKLEGEEDRDIDKVDELIMQWYTYGLKCLELAAEKGPEESKLLQSPKMLPSFSFSHELKLSSSYGRVNLSSRDSSTCEPAWTSAHPAFLGTVDYIFYSHENMKVIAILEPYPIKWVLKHFQRLPSHLCPSDHISLIADLIFI